MAFPVDEGPIRRPSRRPPPGWFSGKERFQLICLVLSLVLVLRMLFLLRDPTSLDWIFEIGKPPAAAVETSDHGEVISTTPIPQRDTPKPPGTKGDTTPRPQANGPPPRDRAPAATPLEKDQPVGGRVGPLDPAVACREVDRDLIQRFTDRTPKQDAEREAIYQLLCVARSRSQTEPNPEGRRDVLFANLVTEPTLYRGQSIHLRGVLRYLVRREDRADRNPYGIPEYYEAWVFTEDQRENPTLVLCTSVPEGVGPGDGLNANVEFDGYFAKLMLYRDRGGKARYAPMLIAGRLRPAVVELPSGLDDPQALFLAGLVLVILVAGAFAWHRRSRRDREYLARLQSSPPSAALFPPASPVEETTPSNEPDRPGEPS